MSIQLSLNGLSFYSGGAVRTVDLCGRQQDGAAWWDRVKDLLEREKGQGARLSPLVVQYATSEAVLCPLAFWPEEGASPLLRAKGLDWNDSRRPEGLYYGEYALAVLLPDGLADWAEREGAVLSHPLLACLREADRYMRTCGRQSVTVASYTDGMLFVTVHREGRPVFCGTLRVDGEADVLFYTERLARSWPDGEGPVVCAGVYAPWLLGLLGTRYPVTEAPLEFYFEP